MRPELRFTLEQTEHATDGKPWTLYLPCVAVGSAAERLASEIEDGQHVVISSGKLCYRKRQTKLGEQSRMEILVWSIDRLSASTGPTQADTGEAILCLPRSRATWRTLERFLAIKPGNRGCPSICSNLGSRLGWHQRRTSEMTKKKWKPHFHSDEAALQAPKFLPGDPVRSTDGESGVVGHSRSDGWVNVVWKTGTREWVHESDLDFDANFQPTRRR